MGQIPITDRLYKYVTANFTVRFRPGGVQTDFTFTEWSSLVEFILNNREAVVGIIVDLSLVGGSFSVPPGTYNLNGLRLSGVRDPVTGLRPQLQLPDGFFIDPTTIEIFVLDLDIVVTSNSNPIYTPTGTTRITFESTILTQAGGAPFIVIPAGNTDSDPNMYLNDDSTLFGPSVAPLVQVFGGETYSIFVDDISSVGAQTLQYIDDTASIVIYASSNARIDGQTLLAGGDITIIGPEQSNDVFNNIERTYPGKVVHDQGSDILYYRNQANDNWIEIQRADQAKNTFLDLDDTPVSYITHANRDVVVNGAGTGLEFRDRFDQFFLGLFDTPGTYAGAAQQFVRVNSTEDTLQFASIDFIGLGDSPVSYSGFAGYTVKVNNAETGVEFALNNFLGLEDAPATYSGQATKIIAVNGAETGLEFIDNAFIDLVDTPGSYGGNAGFSVEVNGPENALIFVDYQSQIDAKPDNFLDMTDTPNSFATRAGQYLRVNSGETALEFFNPTVGRVYAYHEDNVVVTAIAGINIWTKPVIAPTASELVLFSHDGTGVFTYTGTTTRKFLLTANISIGASGNDKEYEFSWFQGGVAGTRLSGKKIVNGHGTRYFNCTPQAVVSLTNGQTISLGVRNISDATAVTILNISFEVRELV